MLGLPEAHSGKLAQAEWLQLIDDRDVQKLQGWAATPASSIIGEVQEFRICRPDGEVRWLRSFARSQPDRRGHLTRLVGLQIDETDRRHAEEAAREREDRFRLIQEAVLIGTFVTGADQATVGSQQFYRNLGMPEDSGVLDRQTYMSIVHPDDRERVELKALAAIPAAEKLDFEYRINRVDTGEVRWIFSRNKYERTDDGELIRVLGAHLDITEPRRAQLALREAEQRLGLAQEAALIGTFVSDDDRRIKGSKQYFRNLGLPEDMVSIDRHALMDITHPNDRDRVEREAAIAIASAEGYDIEYRINRADTGELRWIYSRIKIERAENGQPLGVVGAHLDITGTKRSESALQESLAFNQSILEASADCVEVIDLDGRLLFMNDQGWAALEIEDASQFVGKNWAELWPRAERFKVEAALQAAREGRAGRFDGGCPTATGKKKWWDVIVTPVRDENGQPKRFLAISRDITEQREQMAQVRWSASHDMLTELPNRRFFQDRLEEILRRADAHGTSVGLLQLDVDEFKQVNDALGHDAGDALLRTFAERLQRAVRQNDIVARLGGDEFAIIVPNLTDSRTLSEIVKRIQENLAEPVIYKGRVFDCSASIGEATYPQNGADAGSIMKCADIALYSAKFSGPGNVRKYAPSMRREMQKRTDMVDRARAALRDDLIFPFYQPKINFRTGDIAGFEALLRWQDTRRRIQHPGAIAAAFDHLDVAQALSERMQLRVFADMRRWLDDGVEFDHVAINASAAEFRQNDFAERLLNRIKAAGIPTRYVELEVTETVFLGRGAEYVDRALHLLSAEGIRIALDDFGTGYASLSHLKEFPVDVIKIDQAFVRNIDIDPDDSAIIRALISLGKKLSIRIVAEGIENRAQARFLAAQGCDYGQGYLFGKAVAAASVPALLARLKNSDTLAHCVAFGRKGRPERVAIHRANAA